MENNQTNVEPGAVVPEVKSSPVSAIFRVFYEPTKVFGTLTGKLQWLLPLIIIAVIWGAFWHITRPIMTQDMKQNVYRMMEKYRQYMTEEQYNEQMARIDRQFQEAMENPFKWYYPLIAIGLPLVFFLIISAVSIITGNFIFGGKANFWIVMNVVAFAAIIGLLGDIVRDLMIISKGTMYVYTGLGLLKPIDDGSILYYLLRQVDIFSVWRIVVTCIGLGVIYKMKPKKFGYVIFPVWIVFIAAVAVLNTFAGGSIIY